MYLILSRFDAEVQESLPPGQEVLVLSTTSNLGGSSGGGSQPDTFQLLIESEDFSIDPYTGLISTKLRLDREKASYHLLVVGLKGGQGSGGEPSDTATVNITVVDINDNDPAFTDSCKDLSLPENYRDKNGDDPFTLIHTVTGYDPDSGANGKLTYSLLNPDGGWASSSANFRVDKETGALSARALDREEVSAYDVVVVATDSGDDPRSARCEFTVRVTDMNDNRPVFSQYIYSTSLREDLPVGSEVLRVSATDSDTGLNAKVRYSIENATDWSFGIDPDTGSIFSVAQLDR